MHLTNSIENSLTNELNEINIDQIRNFINDYDTISESLEYSYPTHIKNRVRKKYKNTKTLPNSLNMVGTFIILTQPSTPSSSNNTSDDYTV